MNAAATDSPATPFDALAGFLTRTYGLVVEVAGGRDASDEVANLREGRIRVSAELPAEHRAFVLAHIFGHLVQHLDGDRYAELLRVVDAPPPVALRPSDESRYFEFEMEASAWGEALMRACMPVSPELLNRFKAFVWVDFTSYLWFLKTGLRTDPSRFETEFARMAAAPIGRLWDAGPLRLPRALDLRGVEISVL